MATTTRLTATELLEWKSRGDTLASPQHPGFAFDLTALVDGA